MSNKILMLSFLLWGFFGCGSDNSSSSTPPSFISGQGGSMARFAISGDYLYTINQREMNILDISIASAPKRINKIRVPFDVETLFAYKDNLYVGASSGMYIYDKSTPTQPSKISNFTHAQSCDPVVVSDDIAYVTLHTNAQCWRGTGVNRLEIIDVKDPKNPKLIKALDMWEPKGLGVDGNKLFICDGSNGLKVFKINKKDSNGTVVVDIVKKESLADIDCYDVIAKDNNLVISNNKDIRQFDYSGTFLEELGRIN